VDLRSGDTQPHDSGHYITKCTSVAPAEGGCPLWQAFLNRILDGDVQLIGFIQRMLGYCLTGLTREQVLFFFYGLGANGKSVLTSTVTGILGEYHRTAPIEMFLVSTHDRHPTELAGLVGRRLVTATETEQGKRWAEARLKQLTGGESVSARFMCRDFFDFVPQFKPLFAGNHKPTLNTVDEAIRRRFRLIPFTVTIPEKERDPELTEKLKTEWPQILQWMIEGCSEWQEHGLAAPASVADATREYLASQDVTRNWLSECTTEDVQSEVTASTLFNSWKEWCEANGEYVGSRKSFSQKLMDLGLPHRHTKNGTAFRGVKVCPLGPC
jgi:putative DNA primase/helicase